MKRDKKIKKIKLIICDVEGVLTNGGTFYTENGNEMIKFNTRDGMAIELLKKIHFLLKDQGMTINGVKKILNNKEPLKLDEIANHSIKASKLKNKLVKISNIIKNLKTIK